MNNYKAQLQPSGKTFEVPEGVSILTAALDSGISLAYSCRAGNCSTCKAKILEGQIDHADSSLSYLVQQDRDEGYALLCQARAKSDLVIEAEELTILDNVQPRMTPGRIAQMDKADDDVMILKVRLPMNENLLFVAGQYMDVLLPGGARRAYSIANAPELEGARELEFHVRHLPGGLFSGHVFSTMKRREIQQFEGPYGTFYVRENSSKPIIFVATGTGAAPVQGMLIDLFKKRINAERPVHFYWGGRTAKSLYLADQFSQWQKQHENFVFVPVLSRPTEQCQWTGRTGYVHQAVMHDFPDLSGHQVYACGSPKMVEAARAEFTRAAGLSKNDFFADEFLPAADVGAAANT